MRTTRQTVHVDDRSLELDLQCQAQLGGDGEVVLFVHGLGGSGRSWAPIARRLAPRFRTLAPDLPGFGRSVKPDVRYTPTFFVEALEALLDHLEIPQAHVVGTSMGGQVTLELALRRPERVGRVVAVAPAGVPPRSFEGTPALDAYARLLDARTEAEVREALAATQPEGSRPQEPGRDPSEVLAYVRSPGAKRAFTSALEESARARRLGPLLGTVHAETLLVWGDEDPIIPLDVCAPVIPQVEGLEVAVFPGCGHGPQGEQPEAFAKLVEEFLEIA